jgi:hypothetical protein
MFNVHVASPHLARAALNMCLIKYPMTTFWYWNNCADCFTVIDALLVMGVLPVALLVMVVVLTIIEDDNDNDLIIFELIKLINDILGSKI